MDCPICSWTAENTEYVLLFETRLWRVTLAPNQCLVGRCVVALKRHAGDLVDLTPEEILELWAIMRRLQQALRAAFDATLFNWSCLMNHAYQEHPPDPHVHWWAVPRYDHVVEIDGLAFEDPDFGEPYGRTWREIPPEIRIKIVERIKTALPPS